VKTLTALFFSTVLLCTPVLPQSQNPVPFLNQPLIPASVVPGGPGFTLTVNGTGFVSGSTVNWNGSGRATTFVTSSQLTASISSSDIATATTALITVSNPAPGGGTSNVVFLPVREPSTFVSLNRSMFNLSTELGTVYLTEGDFNKDGNQDMAITIGGNNPTISILLGNGDGTFQQGAEYGVSNANNIFSTDVNNDGNLDLLVPGINSNGRGLAVFLGNGDGTFQPAIVTLSSNQLCCQYALADVNGDGAIDLVAVGSYLCVLLGNGDGSFKPATCTSFPESFDFVTVGDFNRDGKLDLAITGFNNSGPLLAILLGNGDGTFRTSQIYITNGLPSGLTTADFDGDGNLDLAIVDSKNSSVVIAYGMGDGTFRRGPTYSTAFNPFSIGTADVNGDGKLDLVIDDNGYGIADFSILLGNGNGTFQPSTVYDAGTVDVFAIADFNNDGRLDVGLTTSSDTIAVLVQDNGTVMHMAPSQLNFAAQLTGSVSPAKAITVSNTGSSPVGVSNVAISANFSQLNNCTVIQPGHSCEVGVYFTPTVTGNLTGYVAITDNGGGSPQIVPLFGIGTIVSLSPTELNFGNWPVGSVSTPLFVTLTNEGNVTLNISQIGIGGANGGNFSEVNACGKQLVAGAHCTINVIFHPTAQGQRNGVLGVFDDGGGSPQLVTLTGTGT